MDNIHRNDDELLSAYIDGALPANEAIELVERLAKEPALVERLEAMRSGDDAVRAVYGQLDRIPLPGRVTQMLDMATDEADKTDAVSPGKFLGLRVASFPVAIAASVALLAGVLTIRQMQIAPQTGTVDSLTAGQFDSGDGIHEFLETGFSGRPGVLDESTQVRIILSFESEGGNYCRQLYVSSDEKSVHGVACKAGGDWQLLATAEGAPGKLSGEFQPAASDTPEAISATVDRLIGTREPLTRDEERKLISVAWKKSAE